ncbi:E3 ubiquitin-protein ligase SH3RF1 isoform X2 [Dunckerocampus dactyliophorus]|uniref:E3 ubiquitin-protein ligase SH3RF1 isoform X2 n=1 Tax=Dunckerocampus dactyliophorus TaxID=161453 RepID=UPI002406296D|nr:E3 ubiquitin-protein ligase SH3RF1 isoform X2 [Dunckerocampus dactyliophorus]
MDESVLLDLLECPVCLERLDASAKVLPCQHTFCRRCLQGIVGSRGELRCPECRTLVECGVDELPSNILLVRLLDGIKQRPRKPGTTNGTSGAGGRAAREQGAPGVQPQRAQAKSSLVRGVPQLPCAKALYNYDGKEPGDLKFSKGDVIILRRQVDENWYHGEMGGVHGFFPTNFVQVIKPLPQPPPQCKALYDFELKDKEADKDCLPFSKDDILTVIRRVDENWAEGMLGDKIGIFPISYVEFNSAARQLIESDKPPDPNGESGEGASSGPQSNGAQRDKKNSKKRHSFTSLTMSHKPVLAPPPQRHSMEISGPVLISSSNPTAAARIGEMSGGLSCSAPSQDALPPPPPPPPQSSGGGVAYSLAAGQRPSPSVSDQSGRQRPTVYVAMFPYTPRKEDELELRKGEMFVVLERCQDGWFKGTSMHSGKMGVFPGNYMGPLGRTASGSSQAKAPLSVCTQAGRGIVVSTSSSHLGAIVAGPESSKLPAAQSGATCQPVQAVPAVPPAQTATGQQPKVSLHVSSQMTVNQARNAVRTAANHSQDRPTAAVTPIQSGPPGAYLPHLSACPQQPPPGPAQGCARVGVALGCAAASLTPPNVSAASLEGGDLSRPVPVLAVPAGSGNASALSSAGAAPACRPDKDTKREKKSLLKLLSNKKKSRSSPPPSPTLEAEQTAIGESPQGAAGPEISLPCGIRGGPPEPDVPASPSPSSSSSSSEPCHRKNTPLDASAPIAPPPRQPCSSLSSLQHDARPIICERYRVVVSYPPQSEAELELKEGDIVFVHRKREDGWFKGTLQRNGRTGLFPGSFVDIM